MARSIRALAAPPLLLLLALGSLARAQEPAAEDAGVDAPETPLEQVEAAVVEATTDDDAAAEPAVDEESRDAARDQLRA
ncbi:MAG: hypothetical protein J0L92_29265, partial [Deltaproteobacteria bacterium]|nr:hypothetical protein [Deltaproteobacteria bacterium]